MCVCVWLRILLEQSLIPRLKMGSVRTRSQAWEVTELMWGRQVRAESRRTVTNNRCFIYAWGFCYKSQADWSSVNMLHVASCRVGDAYLDIVCLYCDTLRIAII